MNTPYALLGDCFIYSISVILTIFNTRYTLFNTHFVPESDPLVFLLEQLTLQL